LNRMARGEELTFEEQSEIKHFISYETWKALTEALWHKQRGEPIPEYVREKLRFLGLEDASAMELDRIRDAIHRELEKLKPEGLKSYGRYSLEVLDMVVRDFFKHADGCGGTIRKDKLFIACRVGEEEGYSGERESIVEVRYEGAGVHSFTIEGTWAIPTGDIYTPPDVECKEVNGKKICETEYDSEAEKETILDAMASLECSCRVIDSKVVCECPKNIDEWEIQERLFNPELAEEEIYKKIDKILEVPDVVERIECDILDTYHIRHEYGEWTYEGGGGDYLITTFACKGKTRPLLSYEDELKFAEWIRNVATPSTEE